MHTARYPPGPGAIEAIAKMNRGGLLRGAAAFFTETARKYAPIAHWKMNRAHFYLVDDPDVIEDVLVHQTPNFHKGRGVQRLVPLLGQGLLTSEEPLHLRQRRLAQPAFHRDRIATYTTQMVEETQRAMATWTDGATIDVGQAMMHLTLAIAARTFFGTNVDADADTIGRALTDAMRILPLAMSPFGELIDRMPWLPAQRRFLASRATLDTVIYRIIEERRASGDRGDLLSMLLLARDDDQAMSDEQVRDEAITIFTAGHETTANALTWTWGLLGRTPTVAARMRAEIDTVLGKRAATLADVPNLTYTRDVLSESMRLYPPAWVISRRAMQPVNVGGYALDPGSVVVTSPYATHRNPRYFEDPLVFRPERWPEIRPTLPKFAYFPFGGGNRLCIGESFAWTEGIVALATIAQQYALEPVDAALPEIEPLVTLRPRTPVRARLSLRRTTVTQLASVGPT